MRLIAVALLLALAGCGAPAGLMAITAVAGAVAASAQLDETAINA